MVGSHFVATSPFQVVAAGRTNPESIGLEVLRFDPLDFLRPDDVGRYVASSGQPVVVNFAARTDVDGIERERPSPGASQGGPAWTVNVLSARSIARSARATGKFLVHLSTNFVFDGASGPYSESDRPSPLTSDLSWYGWTKGAAEREVVAHDPNSAIVRIALPYRAHFPGKLDFARRLVESWRKGQLAPLYSDQQITPTWIPDISRALTKLIERRASGVFHVASPISTTPLEFGSELLAQLGADRANLPSSLLAANRIQARAAPRPPRGGLRIGRLAELGIVPTPWKDGIRELVREEFSA